MSGTGVVIWITGYSSVGKTTVARALVKEFEGANVQTIHLDGDELRAAFGGSWGFEKGDRVALARIYLELAFLLASQGHVVILSAVAMFSEVHQFFYSSDIRGLQIYLDASLDERKRRDKVEKGVYAQLARSDPGYDLPPYPSMTLTTDSGSGPDQLAREIFNFYQKGQFL